MQRRVVMATTTMACCSLLLPSSSSLLLLLLPPSSSPSSSSSSPSSSSLSDAGGLQVRSFVSRLLGLGDVGGCVILLPAARVPPSLLPPSRNTHTLARSRTHARTRSLTHARPRSLAHSLTHSLPRLSPRVLPLSFPWSILSTLLFAPYPIYPQFPPALTPTSLPDSLPSLPSPLFCSLHNQSLCTPIHNTKGGVRWHFSNCRELTFCFLRRVSTEPRGHQDRRVRLDPTELQEPRVSMAR